METVPETPRITIIDRAEVLTVRTTTDEIRADAWALTLLSASIKHELRRDPSGAFVLRVLALDYERAERLLDLWEEENREHEDEKRRALACEHAPVTATSPPSLAGVAIAVLLAAFFFVTQTRAASPAWFDRGASVSSLVLQGEWWRAITALTLHGGVAHLLGNAAATAVFVTAVMRRSGNGFGALLVLLAGTFGNLMNAAAYALAGTPHSSIGFSTATFGAIGLLGGMEFARRRMGGPRGRVKAWVAVAASLALLGMLGAGAADADVGSPGTARWISPAPRAAVDVFAHVFGLFAGGVLGGIVGFGRLRVRSWGAQVALGALALALVAAAWWLAGAGQLGRFIRA